jgi:hypothetical protein
MKSNTVLRPFCGGAEVYSQFETDSTGVNPMHDTRGVLLFIKVGWLSVINDEWRMLPSLEHRRTSARVDGHCVPAGCRRTSLRNWMAVLTDEKRYSRNAVVTPSQSLIGQLARHTRETPLVDANSFRDIGGQLDVPKDP